MENFQRTLTCGAGATRFLFSILIACSLAACDSQSTSQEESIRAAEPSQNQSSDAAAVAATDYITGDVELDSSFKDVTKLESHQVRSALESIVGRLDPSQAKEFTRKLLANPDLAQHSDLITKASEIAMRQHPEQWLHWIKETFDTDSASLATSLSLENTTFQQFDSIISALTADWGESGPQLHIQAMASKLATVDPEKAFDTVQTLDNEMTRNSAITAVYEHWAAIDPTGALQHASDTESTKLQARSYPLIFSRWADINPNEVERYVTGANLPPEVAQAGYEILSMVKIGNDPEEAYKWAMDLDSEVVSSNLIVNMSHEFAVRDATKALTLNQKNPDPVLREFNQKEILKTWAMEDLSSAEKFNRENPLSDPALQNEITAYFTDLKMSGMTPLGQ